MIGNTIISNSPQFRMLKDIALSKSKGVKNTKISSSELKAKLNKAKAKANVDSADFSDILSLLKSQPNINMSKKGGKADSAENNSSEAKLANNAKEAVSNAINNIAESKDYSQIIKTNKKVAKNINQLTAAMQKNAAKAAAGSNENEENSKKINTKLSAEQSEVLEKYKEGISSLKVKTGTNKNEASASAKLEQGIEENIENSVKKQNTLKNSANEAIENSSKKSTNKTKAENQLNLSLNLNSQSSGKTLAKNKLDSVEKYTNVKLEEIAEKTSQAVSKVSTQGATQSSAKLILQPQSLGTVHVEIQLSGKLLKLNMKAESQEAIKAIESQIAVLKEKLSQNGILSQSIDVSLNDKQENQQKSFENQNGKKEADRSFREDYNKFLSMSKNSSDNEFSQFI